jgi:hypothetical protein
MKKIGPCVAFLQDILQPTWASFGLLGANPIAFDGFNPVEIDGIKKHPLF